MDFMHDQLGDGRSTCSPGVIGDCNRDALITGIDFSPRLVRANRALRQIIEEQHALLAIRYDNDLAHLSDSRVRWAASHRIVLNHIQLGRSQQSSYVGRFNRAVRYEWPSHYYRGNLQHVQQFAMR